MFKDKIVLVTGSTSGIGKQIAKDLLEHGAKVIINYCNNDLRAEKTRLEFVEYFVNYKDNFTLIKADVTIEEEVINMFNKIYKQYGKLDYLVNNAGMSINSYIENANVSDWRKVLDVNLTGKFICTKYSIPLLKLSNTPSIINISSRLAKKPIEESSAYCCSESGILMLTKTSALELSKYGIRVNSVSPGLTLTPLSTTSWSKEEITSLTLEHPLKKLATTKNISDTVLFLLSDKSSYINGEDIGVNGGSLLL